MCITNYINKDYAKNCISEQMSIWTKTKTNGKLMIYTLKGRWCLNLLKLQQKGNCKIEVSLKKESGIWYRNRVLAPGV